MHVLCLNLLDAEASKKVEVCTYHPLSKHISSIIHPSITVGRNVSAGAATPVVKMLVSFIPIASTPVAFTTADAEASAKALNELGSG